MISTQDTGTTPDHDTQQGGRHSGDSYSGPALDLPAHRRARVEAAETEVAS